MTPNGRAVGTDKAPLPGANKEMNGATGFGVRLFVNWLENPHQPDAMPAEENGDASVKNSKPKGKPAAKR